MKSFSLASCLLILAAMAGRASSQASFGAAPVTPEQFAASQPAPGHGLPGKTPGTEQWLVHFATRSFDLSEFRAANLAGRPAAEIEAIVARYQASVSADQAQFVEAVERLGGRVYEQFWLVNGAAIEIAHAQIAAVHALPGVTRVDPNLPAWPLIKTATNAANHNSDAVNARGYKGKGIATAIVDTGLDASMANSGKPHQTFYEDGDKTKRNRLLANYQMGSIAPDNSHPHGTGVAGITAGGIWGNANADHGHAPHADIVGYSLSNNTGGGSDEATIVKAWQAVAADATKHNIKTANNSYSGWSDPLNLSQQALDACALTADVMIVVAAGNGGSSTVSSQSCANGLAVAALNATAHTVASFSSKGPISGDTQRFYPDIAGCGVQTVMPQSDNESTNYVADGTSMASPQVCGAATLIRAQVPALKADQTKAILLASALDISTKNASLNRNAYGMGLSRDDAAIDLAMNANAHGRGNVTTAQPTWQKVVTVQRGRTYRAAVSWMRQDTTSKSWSNLEVELLQGSNVVAESKTPRNLYEVVIYRAAADGALFLRVSGASIEKGSQDFGWAFTEGSGPPIEAEYTTFGAGCNGAPQGCKPCFARNWTQTLAPKTTTAAEVAFLEYGQPLLNLCGIDIYASARTAPVNVTFAVRAWDNNLAQPGAVLGSAVVQVGTTPGIYRATISPAVRIAANDLFFVAIGNADQLNLPVSTSGEIGIHYERRGSSWSLLSDTRWQYQVHCDKGQQPPALANSGKPVLGQSFGVNLSAARSQTPAVLFLGLSNTAWGALPLPLTYAPGCQLLVSGDVMFGLATSATGTGSVSIAVPSAKDLVGLFFYNQFLVVDPANALSLVASNGGRAKVGEY